MLKTTEKKKVNEGRRGELGCLSKRPKDRSLVYFVHGYSPGAEDAAQRVVCAQRVFVGRMAVSGQNRFRSNHDDMRGINSATSN